jgi:hypothetical protein
MNALMWFICITMPKTFEKNCSSFLKLTLKREDDEDPDAATILIYIKQTRPYQVGDIVMDVYDNVIYTAGTAVGAHASRVVVTSKRINVYTSVKAYVDG